MHDFDSLFEQIAGLKVAVIGDIMLDTYWWGKVDRISPEAPVPVVSLQNKEYRLGGAANVCLNTVALNAATTVFTVIGNDEDAGILTAMLQESRVNTEYIIRSDERITTNKTRVMGRNQQMMRLDAEITRDISTSDEELLVSRFTSYLQTTGADVVIFEDYNKGILTENLITILIDICRQHGIITTVDPKRNNFFAYKQVDIFKPNLKEVKDALNVQLEEVSLQTLGNVHQKLHAQLQHNISLITLSEKGVFIQDSTESAVIPTHQRNITDVSGAGDTVIAVASLVYAATKNILLAAAMANLAGGLVCEEVGTAAINAEKLLGECKSSLKR